MTNRELYRLLDKLERIRADLPSQQVHTWWGDEPITRAELEFLINVCKGEVQ